MAAVAAHSLKFGFLPDMYEEYVQGNMLLLHIVEELGAALILVGLSSIWCGINYEGSKFIHLSLVIFALVFSLLHWFDARGPISSITGASCKTNKSEEYS